MVELADTLDLGSNGIAVQVQVLLPAPDNNNPNQIFIIGDGFGLFVYFPSHPSFFSENKTWLDTKELIQHILQSFYEIMIYSLQFRIAAEYTL